MESVRSNQEVSAVVVATEAEESCAKRVFRCYLVSSSFLTACLFGVSIPSSRALFPRRRPRVLPRGPQAAGRGGRGVEGVEGVEEIEGVTGGVGGEKGEEVQRVKGVRRVERTERIKRTK